MYAYRADRTLDESLKGAGADGAVIWQPIGTLPRPKLVIKEESDSRLRVERYLDASTGKAKVRFTWDGLLIDKVQLHGSIVDRFSGLSLIEKDLRNASRWFTKAEALIDAADQMTSDGAYVLAQDRVVFDDVKAYFVAALAFYGKAFTEAAGRRAQMQRDWLDVKYRPAHDHYMQLRHNFAAHSGDMAFEGASTQILLVPDSGSFQLKLHTNRSQPDFHRTDPHGVGFGQLIENAIGVVVQKYDEAAERIGSAIFSKGLAYWQLQASAENAVNLDKIYKTFHKKR